MMGSLGTNLMLLRARGYRHPGMTESVSGKESCFHAAVWRVFRLGHAQWIDSPQIALPVVRHPHRSESKTNGICPFVVAILINDLVCFRIDSCKRSATGGCPYVTATVSDVAAPARDFDLNRRNNLVLRRINARDTSIRLTQHPDGTVSAGCKPRCGWHTDLRDDFASRRINAINPAFAGACNPNRPKRRNNHC